MKERKIETRKEWKNWSVERKLTFSYQFLYNLSWTIDVSLHYQFCLMMNMRHRNRILAFDMIIQNLQNLVRQVKELMNLTFVSLQIVLMNLLVRQIQKSTVTANHRHTIVMYTFYILYQIQIQWMVLHQIFQRLVGC